MRLVTSATLITALSVAPQLTPAAWAQESSIGSAPVPVEREPHHRPVFTNDALRVIQLEMPLGATSLFHTHVNDNLTVRIVGETRTQTLGGEWGEAARRPPGSVGTAEYVGRTAPAHRVQNVGAVPFLQIVVENLRAGGWSTPPLISGPDMTLLQENRAFRAYRVMLTSHGSSSSHQHAVPTVVVLVSGQVDAAGKDGKALSAPGAWVVVPPNTPHALTRSGTSDAELVEVEVR